jgi:ligand-binding sensor protein
VTLNETFPLTGSRLSAFAHSRKVRHTHKMVTMSCCRSVARTSHNYTPSCSRILSNSRQQHEQRCRENIKFMNRGRQKRCFSSSSSGGSESSTSHPLVRFLQWYSQQLDHRPLLTKGLTSGTIAASGDIICQFLTNNNSAASASESSSAIQQISDQNENEHNLTMLDKGSHHDKETGTTTTTAITTDIVSWDPMRTLRFFMMGGLWVGPVTHYWYTILSTRLVPGPAIWANIIQRLVLDQFVFAPIFAPSFMGLLWSLEGVSSNDVQSSSINSIMSRLYRVTPELIVSGWKLWIPSMGINFSIVPLKYQVLFSNVVSLVWNVYLSYLSSTSSSGTTTTLRPICHQPTQQQPQQ